LVKVSLWLRHVAELSILLSIWCCTAHRKTANKLKIRGRFLLARKVWNEYQ
jgi:hypothetical protein